MTANIISNYHQRFKSPEQRFWEKVNKDGITMPEMNTKCWDWQGSTSHGYGYIGVGKKILRAHRYSWTIHHGEIPKGHDYHGVTCVLHRCDNRQCVNPDHLILGTNKDNVNDKMDKGRFIPNKGEFHGMAKLTRIQVRVIRARHPLVTRKELAATFNVSIGAIDSIMTRKTWKHVL